jgi:hypothetical protein
MDYVLSSMHVRQKILRTFDLKPDIAAPLKEKKQ